jgi:hypothetical protein
MARPDSSRPCTSSAARKPNERLLTSNLGHLPGVLMGGAAVDQDVKCSTVGRYVFGPVIDRELET